MTICNDGNCFYSSSGNESFVWQYIVEVSDINTLDNKPIAILLVKRTENYYYYSNNVLKSASICIDYKLIKEKHRRCVGNIGSFVGAYKNYIGEEAVSLTSSLVTSSGAVFLDLDGLEGKRIGSYLMNQIVIWAKKWPQANVCQIDLRKEQAETEEGKTRRNKFYSRFGVEFDFFDKEFKTGASRPMLADKLIPIADDDKPDELKILRNIKEAHLEEFLSEIVSDRDNLRSELQHSKEANLELKGMMFFYKNHPVRSFLTNIWRRITL